MEQDIADWDDAWHAADPKNVDLLDKASASDTASTQSLNDAGRKVMMISGYDDELACGFVSEARAGVLSEDEEISDDEQPLSGIVPIAPDLEAQPDLQAQPLAKTLLRPKAKAKPKPKAKSKPGAKGKAKAKGKDTALDVTQSALPWLSIASAPDDASSSDPLPGEESADDSTDDAKEDLSSDDSDDAKEPLTNPASAGEVAKANEAEHEGKTELASSSEPATETPTDTVAAAAPKRKRQREPIAVVAPKRRKPQPTKKASPPAVVSPPVVSPPAAIVVPEGVEFDDRVRCGRCGDLLDPFKMQISNKSKGSWRCRKCNTRGVQMSKTGEFKKMSEAFEGMSEEAKNEFWKGTHKLSPKQLEEFCQTTISTTMTETKVTRRAGEYLPLTVYEQRGFDPVTIADKCLDFVDDPILGRCYRLMLLGGANESSRSTTRAEQVSRPVAASAKGKAAPKSSAHAKASEARKLVVDATKILTKVSATKIQLECALRHKHISRCTDESVKAAKDALKEMKLFEAAAQDVLKNKSEDLPTNQTVDDELKKAKQSHIMLKQMASLFDR